MELTKINVSVIFAVSGKIRDCMGQSRFGKEMVHLVLDMFQEVLVGIKTEQNAMDKGRFKAQFWPADTHLKVVMCR